MENQEVDALQKLKQKLKSQTGASITFALLLFLVCAVVGSVVLTAGTAAAGRMSELAKMDQRYYSVTSAAQLLRDTMDGKQVSVTQKTVTEITEDGTTSSQTSPQVDTEVESPILKASALQLVDETAEDITMAWNLTGSSDIQNAALNVKIEEALSSDGTMTMRISNAADTGSGGTSGGSYIYTLQMVFTADKTESVDKRTKEQYSDGEKIETVTETKTTNITWRLNSIGKAVAEPASTGSVGP